MPQGHTSDVNSVAVTPDGKWAVSGSDDMSVRIWELATGACLRVLQVRALSAPGRMHMLHNEKLVEIGGRS